MKFGLVTKIEKDFVVVMTDKMTIERIKLKDQIRVGERIEFGVGDLYRGFRMSVARRLAFLLAAILVMLTSFVAFASKGDDELIYASVSVDINPSVEFDLNYEMKVVGVRAMNDDAEKLSLDLIIGMSVEDAMEQIIMDAQELGFMVKSDKILVATVVYSENATIIEMNMHKFLELNKDKYDFLYIKQSNVIRTEKSDKVSIGRRYVQDNAGDQQADYQTVEELFEVVSIMDQDVAKAEFIEEESAKTTPVAKSDKTIEQSVAKVTNTLEKAEAKVEKILLEDETNAKTTKIVEKAEVKVEKTVEKAEVKVEKTEDKAEVKVEKTEAKTEVKIEKTEEKAEVKTEKSEEKADKVEVKKPEATDIDKEEADQKDKIDDKDKTTEENVVDDKTKDDKTKDDKTKDDKTKDDKTKDDKTKDDKTKDDKTKDNTSEEKVVVAPETLNEAAPVTQSEAPSETIKDENAESKDDDKDDKDDKDKDEKHK